MHSHIPLPRRSSTPEYSKSTIGGRTDRGELVVISSCIDAVHIVDMLYINNH